MTISTPPSTAILIQAVAIAQEGRDPFWPARHVVIAWSASVLLVGCVGLAYSEQWFPPRALLVAALVVTVVTLLSATVSFVRLSRVSRDERPPGRWLSAAAGLLALATLLLIFPIAWLYVFGPYAFSPLRLIGL